MSTGDANALSVGASGLNVQWEWAVEMCLKHVLDRMRRHRLAYNMVAASMAVFRALAFSCLSCWRCARSYTMSVALAVQRSSAAACGRLAR